MSDMYEKVSRPAERPKRRRGTAVFVLLAAAVLALILWVLSAYGILSVRPRFYQFVSAISDSTVYAYENGTLRSEMDGQSARVSGDNTYSLYHALSVMTPTRVLSAAPDGPADLILDYGDGSVLSLWRMTGNDQSQSRGIDLLFETGDGQRYLFECKTDNLSPLRAWASLDRNEPWEQ